MSTLFFFQNIISSLGISTLCGPEVFRVAGAFALFALVMSWFTALISMGSSRVAHLHFQRLAFLYEKGHVRVNVSSSSPSGAGTTTTTATSCISASSSSMVAGSNNRTGSRLSRTASMQDLATTSLLFPSSPHQDCKSSAGGGESNSSNPPQKRSGGTETTTHNKLTSIAPRSSLPPTTKTKFLQLLEVSNCSMQNEEEEEEGGKEEEASTTMNLEKFGLQKLSSDNLRLITIADVRINRTTPRQLLSDEVPKAFRPPFSLLPSSSVLLSFYLGRSAAILYNVSLIVSSLTSVMCKLLESGLLLTLWVEYAMISTSFFSSEPEENEKGWFPIAAQIVQSFIFQPLQHSLELKTPTEAAVVFVLLLTLPTFLISKKHFQKFRLGVDFFTFFLHIAIVLILLMRVVQVLQEGGGSSYVGLEGKSKEAEMFKGTNHSAAVLEIHDGQGSRGNYLSSVFSIFSTAFQNLFVGVLSSSHHTINSTISSQQNFESSSSPSSGVIPTSFRLQSTKSTLLFDIALAWFGTLVLPHALTPALFTKFGPQKGCLYQQRILTFVCFYVGFLGFLALLPGGVIPDRSDQEERRVLPVYFMFVEHERWVPQVLGLFWSPCIAGCGIILPMVHSLGAIRPYLETSFIAADSVLELLFLKKHASQSDRNHRTGANSNDDDDVDGKMSGVRKRGKKGGDSIVAKNFSSVSIVVLLLLLITALRFPTKIVWALIVGHAIIHCSLMLLGFKLQYAASQQVKTILSEADAMVFPERELFTGLSPWKKVASSQHSLPSASSTSTLTHEPSSCTTCSSSTSRNFFLGDRRQSSSNPQLLKYRPKNNSSLSGTSTMSGFGLRRPASSQSLLSLASPYTTAGTSSSGEETTPLGDENIKRSNAMFNRNGSSVCLDESGYIVEQELLTANANDSRPSTPSKQEAVGVTPIKAGEDGLTFASSLDTPIRSQQQKEAARSTARTKSTKAATRKRNGPFYERNRSWAHVLNVSLLMIGSFMWVGICVWFLH